MNILTIIQAFLGVAEEVVPVFIHNPQTQKIEGVVITTLNHVMTNLGPKPPQS